MAIKNLVILRVTIDSSLFYKNLPDACLYIYLQLQRVKLDIEKIDGRNRLVEKLSQWCINTTKITQFLIAKMHWLALKHGPFSD